MRQFSSRFSFALISPSFLCILLLLTTACSGNKGAQASSPQAMPVQVKTAQPAKVNDTTEYVATRSEEHTSELQSPYDLVCRLLLEKKKKKTYQTTKHKK